MNAIKRYGMWRVRYRVYIACTTGRLRARFSPLVCADWLARKNLPAPAATWGSSVLFSLAFSVGELGNERPGKKAAGGGSGAGVCGLGDLRRRGVRKKSGGGTGRRTCGGAGVDDD